MPGRPIRESAGGQFIAFHHFLCRSGISAALLADAGKISTGAVIEVEGLHHIVGIGEIVLENALRPSAGKNAGIVAFQAVAQGLDGICRGNHPCIILGIEKGTGRQGIGGSLVQAAAGIGLLGKVLLRESEVILHGFPAVGLGRNGLVLDDGGQVFVVNDNLLVPLDQFKIQPAADEAEFRFQTDPVGLGEVGAQGMEVIDGFIGAAQRPVQGAPRTHVHIHIIGCQGGSAVGDLTRDEAHAVIQVGAVLDLVRQGIRHAGHTRIGDIDVVNVAVHGIDGILGRTHIGPHDLVGNAVPRGQVQKFVAGGGRKHRHGRGKKYDLFHDAVCLEG